MTGQDAVKIAQGFDDALDVTGVILTKMDGDARGGAALSIYGVTEEADQVHRRRREDGRARGVPSRPHGRPHPPEGDIVSLVEKAQGAFDEDEAKKLEKKVRKEGMDLEDFLTAMQQMQKLGPLEGLLKMLPGVNTKMLKQAKMRPEAHEARRGDRALDDAGGAQEAGADERLAPRAHREGQRAARSARSTGCSSSSARCRR